MTIKSNIFLCLITFTIALHETPLYAQNKSLILKKLERPDELLAMNTSVMDADTAELAFFSFEEGKAVPYRRKFVNTEDSKTSTVYVCENNSIVLSTTHDFGQDAIYSWKGPAGFSSLSQQIRLEKITPFQAGFYNFTIKKNGSTTIGKIKLMVKERPKAIATGGRFCFGEPVKLTSAEAGSGVTYRWTLPPTDFAAYTPEISVEHLSIGSYTYYLSVSKNGCKSVDTAKVEIRQIPVAIANNASIKVGQVAKLEAHDAGTDAEYLWKGPYIDTIKDKTASLSGLSAGKYIYVLRVMKQGCSSMNISTVEVQKDDAKASIKN